MPNNLPKKYIHKAINDSPVLRQAKKSKAKLSQKQKDLRLALLSKKILNKEVNNPIMVSVSEAAKLSGIGSKTIRRAIESKIIRFTVKQNRYFIDLKSLIRFMNSTTKRKNKFITEGLGQYVKEWHK